MSHDNGNGYHTERARPSAGKTAFPDNRIIITRGGVGIIDANSIRAPATVPAGYSLSSPPEFFALETIRAFNHGFITKQQTNIPPAGRAPNF